MSGSLDRDFWLDDAGEVGRLGDDVASGESADFRRVDAIRRTIPVKREFPEAARDLRPGDRIISGPGNDA